jgi:hypothetical protein
MLKTEKNIPEMSVKKARTNSLCLSRKHDPYQTDIFHGLDKG